jgi:hypothetical protein
MNKDNIKYITFDEAMEALGQGETIGNARLILNSKLNFETGLVESLNPFTKTLDGRINLQDFVDQYSKKGEWYIISEKPSQPAPEPRTGMPFEEALPLLKQGKAIARKKWDTHYLKIESSLIYLYNKTNSTKFCALDYRSYLDSEDLLATDWEEWKLQKEESENQADNALQKQLDIAVKALNTIYEHRKTWKEEELHHFIINSLNIIEGRLSDDEEEPE